MTCNLLGYLLDGESSVGWKDFPTQEAEFTIVGTYGMLASQSVQPTSRNVVLFIPDSCMPEGYGGDLTAMLPSDQYSFVLKSSEDQAAFTEENQEALLNLGFTLLFADSSAENFWSTVTPMTRTLLTNSVVWGLALTVAVVLAAALYLWQRRKEYAISRALGMPIKRANKQMLLPMLLMGIIAIPVGGALSWRFAIRQAQQMLASIEVPDGVTPTVTISPAWLIVLCAAVLCVLLCCLFVGVRVVAHTPVLNLLQGEQGRTRKASNKPALAGTSRLAGHEAAKKGDILQPTLHENKKAVASRVTRFIFRNCCRSSVKAILGIGVACLFTCALIWLAMTISQNRAEIDRLYDTTVVEAEIVKQIPSMTAKGTGGGIIKGSTVDEILASGAIESDYLEAAAEWAGIAADGSTMEADEIGSVTLLAFDQPEEFFADSGAKANIDYADGWGADLFTQSWTQESLETAVPVVLSSGMMQELNRSLLDTVSLYGDDSDEVVINAVIAGTYTGTIQTQDTSEPILMPLSLLGTLENLRGRELCYSTARFSIDPKMNRELSSLTEQMKSIVESEDAGYLALDFVCWDEELTQAIAPMEKNLQLMNTLYPVSLGLSVLIAAGLSVLLTLLNRKEAAILRVLGMPKRRVRIVLCGQQLLPGVLGVVLGILVALFVWKSAMASSGAAILLAAGGYLAGLLLGTIGTARIVAKERPLSLLQIRE
jgi:ABC-type lipoprotein release transport system permease subunit